ncbi:OsmC family protein [Homoserinibacter sp. GY 40078]|uniref:OsmC family protein n=1 Tax=Homoserinibacter sp. GY 40078 TaxID=2603275 RepID=UPI0011C8CF03|nr:OsmC family protein [Homoserinibacter sp. GY 40078]TXK17299.1 OsmC family protein [Homoserinibacter sp. GY 40078]
MDLTHEYAVSVEWTGNLGTGTSGGRRAHSRDHVVRAAGKVHEIHGSADPAFFGDAERWNPEEMLLSALAQCHMLSYLYVAVQRGVVVVAYRDDAVAHLERDADGSGRITGATLRPVVTIAAGSPADADDAHAEAARLCFIASSVAFPVRHEATLLLADDPLS